MSTTLETTTQKSGLKLKENITRLYEAGIRDIVFFEGLPIHHTPFFNLFKQENINVPGLCEFVDGMASTYNATLKANITELQQEFIAQGKPINLTYISTKDIPLPADFKSVSFLGQGALRNGQEFDLSQATPDEKQLMEELYFYDSVHLSSKGALWVATYLQSQLLQKEANINLYHQLCAKQKQQEAIPNLDVRPKEQYIMVIAQNMNGGLTLSGR